MELLIHNLSLKKAIIIVGEFHIDEKDLLIDSKTLTCDVLLTEKNNWQMNCHSQNAIQIYNNCTGRWVTLSSNEFSRISIQ